MIPNLDREHAEREILTMAIGAVVILLTPTLEKAGQSLRDFVLRKWVDSDE